MATLCSGQEYEQIVKEEWKHRDIKLRERAAARKEQLEAEADDIDELVDCGHKTKLLHLNAAKYEAWRKHDRLLATYENYNGDAEQLRLAAAEGDMETCERLVAAGVSVNAPGRLQKAALHHAAEKGNREVAEFLLDNGADPWQGDEYGNTPQLHAMQNGHTDMIQLLIAYSNPNTTLPRSPSQFYDDLLSKSRSRSPKPSPEAKVPALALGGDIEPTVAVE